MSSETIQWYDNHNIIDIIHKGSTKHDLQTLALHLYGLFVKKNLRLVPTWIPREENKLADYFSRLNDTDNFSIDYQSFNFIQKKLGVCTIDRFADERIQKLRRINSKYYCPYSEGVNAFSHNWIDELNSLSPPINLIENTLKHVSENLLKTI